MSLWLFNTIMAKIVRVALGEFDEGEQLETSIQGKFATVCRWCDDVVEKCNNESEWNEEEIDKQDMYDRLVK